MHREISELNQIKTIFENCKTLFISAYVASLNPTFFLNKGFQSRDFLIMVVFMLKIFRNLGN